MLYQVFFHVLLRFLFQLQEGSEAFTKAAKEIGFVNALLAAIVIGGGLFFVFKMWPAWLQSQKETMQQVRDIHKESVQQGKDFIQALSRIQKDNDKTMNEALRRIRGDKKDNT
jgi:uncharacterized protein HemX